MFLVYSVLDTGTNGNRTISSPRSMVIISDKNFPKSLDRNDVDSYLTLTSLFPHTVIEVTFLTQISVDSFDSLDIIGVRQGPDFTKQISGTIDPKTTYRLTTTGESLSFHLLSDSTTAKSASLGFAFSYKGMCRYFKSIIYIQLEVTIQ